MPDPQLSLKGICRQLVLNPLVVACFLGILVQSVGLSIPPGVEPVLKTLGQASLPLGLLCVGAALSLSTARTWVRPIGLSSVTKFLVMPRPPWRSVPFSGCGERPLSQQYCFRPCLLPRRPTSWLVSSAGCAADGGNHLRGRRFWTVSRCPLRSLACRPGPKARRSLLAGCYLQEMSYARARCRSIVCVSDPNKQSSVLGVTDILLCRNCLPRLYNWWLS